MYLYWNLLFFYIRLKLLLINQPRPSSETFALSEWTLRLVFTVLSHTTVRINRIALPLLPSFIQTVFVIQFMKRRAFASHRRYVIFTIPVDIWSGTRARRSNKTESNGLAPGFSGTMQIDRVACDFDDNARWIKNRFACDSGDGREEPR